MKTVSIGEFIDAIEKNGLRQTFGSYFRTDDNEYFNSVHNLEGTINAACAIGQACINLDVVPYNFVGGSLMSGNPPENRRFSELLNRVVALNDGEHETLDIIASKLRQEFREDLNLKINFEEFDYGEFMNGKQKEESK